MPDVEFMLTAWACLVVIGFLAAAVTVGVLLANRPSRAAGVARSPDRAGPRREASETWLRTTCPHCGGALDPATFRRPRWPAIRTGLQASSMSGGMRTAARILVVLQLVGIAVAVVAGLVDIESIVVSGPVLSLLGLLIAVLSIPCRAWQGILFGASAIIMSIACFAAIAGLGLSPHEAQFPIGSAICVYAVVALPLGILAFIGLRRSAGARGLPPGKVVAQPTPAAQPSLM